MTNTTKTGRPAARAKNQKPKAHLLVLWMPPKAMMIAAVIGVVFASGGIAALRYSSAAVPQVRPTDKTLLWQDAPDSPVGTTVGVGDDRKEKKDKLKNWAVAPQYVYGNSSVAVVSEQQKGKALRFYGPANGYRMDSFGKNQRAEQVPDIALESGKTYWIGYDLLVGGSGIAANGWQSMWQLVPQSNGGASKLWLSVNTGRDGLGLETATESLRLGQTPYATWTRLVVGVHMTDSSDSWVEVWRDGQNVIGRRTLAGGALPDGTRTAIIKTGLYRSPQVWDLDLMQADIRIGTTMEAVQ